MGALVASSWGNSWGALWGGSWGSVEDQIAGYAGDDKYSEDEELLLFAHAIMMVIEIDA